MDFNTRDFLALIQLMAASESGRALVYAAFGDRHLVGEFGTVYNHLIDQKATVTDIYQCLKMYSGQKERKETLFQMILNRKWSRM